MAKKEITFEKAMERLEEITELLENGEHPLEKSLELYEEGVKLIKLCNSKLEKVEGAVKILLNEGDKIVEKDFSVDNE